MNSYQDLGLPYFRLKQASLTEPLLLLVDSGASVSVIETDYADENNLKI